MSASCKSYGGGHHACGGTSPNQLENDTSQKNGRPDSNASLTFGPLQAVLAQPGRTNFIAGNWSPLGKISQVGAEMSPVQAT
jgi:hypothetical protein